MKDKQVISCIYCKYFKPIPGICKNGAIGECHRFPMESPVFTYAHWCGEFKRSKK